MTFRKGGNVSRLVEGGSEEKRALREKAIKEGNWLAASVKTNQLFPDLIENVTEAISAYKKAMETGQLLLKANKAFLLASINPLFLILDAMISKIQNQIDDFMGSGIYTIFINGQNPKLSIYKVKSRTPNLRIKKAAISGIYVNPFTNKIEFTAYPIVDIDDMKAAEGNQPYRPGIPHEKSWEMYENNHTNYVIWNGKVFYNRAIPGVSGSAQGKPVLEKSGDGYHDITYPDSIWALGGEMQICKPSKMIEIMNAAFDDKGDVNRPVISEDGIAGALVIILGTSDPAKIVEKLAKLYNYFADIRPIKDAFDIAVELTNDLDALREEKIVVTNLCAPNPGMTNPPIEKWPIKPGKKSSIKAERDIFKKGTNSDNKEKFRRRGIDINSNKEDKVFFKNLRTREVMQILASGTATKFEAPTSGGTDETSNTEWYDHITPGVETAAGDASVDLFTQGTTERYEQSIDVLHETIFPNTRPGDILVEVELDNRLGVIDEEGQPTKPDPGGGDAFKVWNSYVLKNGTKVFGEDDQKEDIMKRIMAMRRWKHDSGADSRQVALYQYYNDKISQGGYEESLTYHRKLSQEETSQREEQLENSALAATSAVGTTEAEIEKIKTQIGQLKVPEHSVGAPTDRLQQHEADKVQKDKQIAEIESSIERTETRIKEKEAEISTREEEKDKALETLSAEMKSVQESESKQVNAQENLTSLETDLINIEKEVRDYEESKRQEIFQQAYDVEMTRIGNSMTFSEADVLAYKYGVKESTPAKIEEKLYRDDQHYRDISLEWASLKSQKSKASQTLETATAAVEGRNEDGSSGEYSGQIEYYDAEIEKLKVEINGFEEDKQSSQTKIETLEEEKVKLDEAIALRNLEISSTHSRFEDKIQELELALTNKTAQLETAKEAERKSNEGIVWEGGSVRSLREHTTQSMGFGVVTDSHHGAPVLAGAPDAQGARLWEELLHKLVNDDDDDQDPDIPDYDDDELGDLTDEESTWAAQMILVGSGLNAADINVDLLRHFEAILDGYLWLPNWKNQGSANLPAPRVCSVQAINKNTLKKEDIPESVYPDFWSMNVEDVVPALRPILELLIDFLEGLKGIGSGLIKKIDDLIEFIEEKIVPKLVKILKLMEEFLALIKIGIVDAGIYFLYIPPANGGTERVRNKLINAGNPPPENIDFTYGMMLFLGGDGSQKTAKLLEAAGLV